MLLVIFSGRIRVWILSVLHSVCTFWFFYNEHRWFVQRLKQSNLCKSKIQKFLYPFRTSNSFSANVTTALHDFPFCAWIKILKRCRNCCKTVTSCTSISNTGRKAWLYVTQFSAEQTIHCLSGQGEQIFIVESPFLILAFGVSLVSVELSKQTQSTCTCAYVISWNGEKHAYWSS